MKGGSSGIVSTLWAMQMMVLQCNEWMMMLPRLAKTDDAGVADAGDAMKHAYGDDEEDGC